MAETRIIRLDQIEVKGLLRKPRAARVAVIKGELERDGQLTPLEVSPQAGAKPWRLTKGWVRREAMLQLGWTEAEAVSVKGTARERRAREIRDNLLQDGCTLLDRARYLAEGKLEYEAANPYARHGYAGKEELPDLATPRFTDWAAKEYGASNERAVQRLVFIGEKLSPSAAEALAETEWAEHQSALEKIARLTPEEQDQVAALLTGDDPVETVDEAIAEVLGVVVPAQEDQQSIYYKRQIALWGNLSAKSKRDFLAEQLETDAALRRQVAELLADLSQEAAE